jgi:small-conductance mechanosensitive channel
MPIVVAYKGILLGALYAVLSTLILIGLLLTLRRVFHRLYTAIDHARHIRPIQVQTLELVSAARIVALLKQTARLLRLGVTLLLFYFYLPLIFSFFPQTREWGVILLAYLFDPVRRIITAFVLYLPSIFFILVASSFCIVALRMARLVFREVELGNIGWSGFYPEWAMPTYKIIELLGVAFTVIIIFPYLPGSSSPAFQGVSIFLGVLISLGSSSAVANIVAGVILTYTRAFQIGDRVRIGDAEGDVIDKTLVVTRLRTSKNVDVTVPNSTVMTSHVENFSANAKHGGLILHTTITVDFDIPWRQVHELLIQAANATPLVLATPSPFVNQITLGESNVTYELNVYTSSPNSSPRIYSDLHQQIQDALSAAKIQMCHTTYHVLTRDRRGS